MTGKRATITPSGANPPIPGRYDGWMNALPAAYASAVRAQYTAKAAAGTRLPAARQSSHSASAPAAQAGAGYSVIK